MPAVTEGDSSAPRADLMRLWPSKGETLLNKRAEDQHNNDEAEQHRWRQAMTWMPDQDDKKAEGPAREEGQQAKDSMI